MAVFPSYLDNNLKPSYLYYHIFETAGSVCVCMCVCVCVCLCIIGYAAKLNSS